MQTNADDGVLIGSIGAVAAFVGTILVGMGGISFTARPAGTHDLRFLVGVGAYLLVTGIGTFMRKRRFAALLVFFLVVIGTALIYRVSHTRALAGEGGRNLLRCHLSCARTHHMQKVVYSTVTRAGAPIAEVQLWNAEPQAALDEGSSAGTAGYNHLRATSSAFVMAMVMIFSACTRTDEGHHAGGTRSTERPRPREISEDVTNENPFTRTSFEEASEPCIAIVLARENSSQSISARVTNKCDHAAAVLTAPMEVRVRRTGKEEFVYERMSSAAYAIMYVVSADLTIDAFRGDGLIRDGGLPVRRPPAYATVPAKGTLNIPIRCGIDAPAGRYRVQLATYEAPQGNAQVRHHPFSCEESVAKHNIGVRRAGHVYLGSDVRLLPSGTIAVEFGTKR